MKRKTKFAVSFFLFILIILTLGFIFGNSLMSRSESAAVSDGTLKIFTDILGKDNPMALFLTRYIRKLAHFTEFGILGTEVLLFFGSIGLKGAVKILSSVNFGLLIAVTDETLQIFSERGSSTLDVQIDYAGYLTFTAVLLLLKYIVAHIRKKRKEVSDASL